MTQAGNGDSSREERLNEAIASYLRGQEGDDAVDRQQWLEKYPEFATELAEFFDDQDEIGAMVGRVGDDSGKAASSEKDVRRAAFANREGEGPTTVHFRLPKPRSISSRYQVKDFHARGGMGEVWLAKDGEIGRQIALKRLRGEREDQKERFLAEAQITGQLEHPGIVPLHDLGIDEDGQPYYIMKYVQGRTLKEAILEHHTAEPSEEGQAQDVPPDVRQLRLLEAFVDLCHAVAFAHSRGVLHRDLKPSNIMLGRFGEMVVLDWGLAKTSTEPERLDGSAYVHVSSSSGSTATQDGSVMGSPAYMAPEMAEGRIAEADETTDVYLLGATLYEILTGRPPRKGESQLDMIELARTVTPTAPRKLKATIPPALEAICLKAMSHRMQDRYPAALQMAEDVQRFLADEPVSVYRESFTQRTWRWCKRHRLALKRSAAAAVALALVAVALFFAQREQALLRQRQALADVAEFRRLADEMHFYAVSSDPAAERAPYYDLQHGIAAGEKALLKAEPWGPGLERLELSETDAALKDEVAGEVYDLHLLMVQTRLHSAHAASEVKQLLELLDRTSEFRKPTQGYYRLRARCLRRLGEKELAEEVAQAAERPGTPATAWDFFLLGEDHRTNAANRREADVDPWAWGPDLTELTKARDAYRAALQEDPSHYWSHLQLGRCLLAQEHETEAIEALGTCIALRPDCPWGYSARAAALAVAGQFEEAHRNLDRLRDRLGEQDAEFWPARLNRGVVYWLSEDRERAEKEFTDSQ